MKTRNTWAIALAMIVFTVLIAMVFPYQRPQQSANIYWQAPDTTGLYQAPDGKLILYGRELIAHTAEYLGPDGSVASMSNGMNCQNCHNDAGTKIFGLNYGGVASTYPQVRARSNRATSIAMRVNECIERSLNGTAIDSNSYEMRAMVGYIRWLGRDVEKGKRPEGSGLLRLKDLPRAADVVKGEVVYTTECGRCHGRYGEGLRSDSLKGFVYPPLWGPDSYNDGAGLYRVGNFAAFVRYNMPLGTTHQAPKLTDEQAWDVAAYVNSQSRPHRDQSNDWPNVAKKPIDHPFGPFADPFSENQHKFGPYTPIRNYYDSIQKSGQSETHVQ